MSELYPTPTRTFLLGDIDAGKVREEWYDEESGVPGHAWIYEYPGRRTKVTVNVRQMKAAGWCVTDPADSELHERRIILTDKGREILAGAS